MKPFARSHGRIGLNLIFCTALSLLASCRKPEITTYQAPKETPAPQSASMASLPTGMMPAGNMPKVTWQRPASWTEQPAGQMRAGAFSLKDDAGHSAEVTIIPLPDSGEDDLSNVNRWRKQIGLPPASTDDLPKLTQSIALDGATAEFFDLAGNEKSILAAMQRRGATIWFVKMIGDKVLVAAQKQTFQSFLASLKIGEESASHETASETPAPAVAPNLPAPKEWQSVAPGPMQMAKFTAANGVEISVSAFPGEVGGVLANVNRWRGQLSLAPITEADLPKTTAPVENLSGAVLADLSSADGTKRTLAVIVPCAGQTAFYKMTGAPAAVEAERTRFIAFVQAAK